MLKKILALIAMLYAVAAFAAVDVNKATEAELDSIKGIGPGISARILEERKVRGDFKDWNDFIGRVGGVGEKTAAKFSSGGLTVNGKKFSASTEAKNEKKDKKEKAEARPKQAETVSATKN